MAVPAIFTEDEQAFLRELSKEGVEFMIVGLAAAALQGAPAVTQDIDLWFKDLGDVRIRAALQRVGGIYVPPTPATPPMFAGKKVALFDIVMTMHGLDSFDREAARAVDVRVGRTTLKVLPLARIIVSKEAAGRAKDRAILPVLRDAAAALDSRRSPPPTRRRPR